MISLLIFAIAYILSGALTLYVLILFDPLNLSGKWDE